MLFYLNSFNNFFKQCCVSRWFLPWNFSYFFALRLFFDGVEKWILDDSLLKLFFRPIELIGFSEILVMDIRDCWIIFYVHCILVEYCIHFILKENCIHLFKASWEYCIHLFYFKWEYCIQLLLSWILYSVTFNVNIVFRWFLYEYWVQFFFLCEYNNFIYFENPPRGGATILYQISETFQKMALLSM